MDISNISKAYNLVDLEVVPDQLLLDPHNPRIAIDMEEEVTYTPDDLTSIQLSRNISSQLLTNPLIISKN